MSKINVSGWKEFKVGELFDYQRGKEGAPRQVPDGNVPMISETSDNNGLDRYVESKNIFPANTITVSVNYAQTVFVQTKPYCASVNIIILSPSEKYKHMTINDLLFVASTIRAYNSKYDYSTKVSKDRLLRTNIKLPVTSTGEPDWQYMDEYIEKLATQARKNVSSLAALKQVEHKIDIKAWKEFKVGELFDVRPSKYVKQNGKTLINAELFDNGDHKVIVNTSANNGIGGYTSQDFTEDGNVITFSDTTDGPSTMFYQDQPFVGYSHVKVMEPIDNIKNSRNVLLYLTATIRKALSLNDYNFTNKLTTQAMNNTSIKLPVTSTGQPDFDYMEKYIDNVQNEAHESLELLKQI